MKWPGPLVILVTLMLTLAWAEIHPDYCRIQRERCVMPHIGCPASASEYDRLSKSWKDIHLKQFSAEDQRLVVEDLNDVKNRIAKGEYIGEGLPAAAAFQIIKWNSELAYLAELSVKKLPHRHDACKIIDGVETTYTLSMQEISDNATLDTFTNNSITRIKVDIKRQGESWIGNFFADATQIGCASVVYNAKGTDIEGSQLKHSDFFYRVLGFRCILNTVAEEKVGYEVGPPCSKCPEGRECDKTYTALCTT